MSQPKWGFLQTLGDISVPEYDGALLLIDETGVYPPELEVYEVIEQPNEDDWENWKVEIYRIIVKVDPRDWYMDKLMEVSKTCDIEVRELADRLLSAKPFDVAYGLYCFVIPYFGAYEFDQDPLVVTMSEAKERVEKYKGGVR